jgi:hypothetical protein
LFEEREREKKKQNRKVPETTKSELGQIVSRKKRIGK